MQTIHIQVGTIKLLAEINLTMTRLDANYTDAWRNER